MAPASAKGSSRLSGLEWRVILLLATINFTHIIDFVIIMPLGERLMDELSLSPQQFTAVVSAYGLAAGIASLVASFIMDRFDRKRVLLTMYAGFALSTLFCGWAANYEMLLLARTLAGVFGGVAAVAVMAVIGDVFPPERRGVATGSVMSAFAVASIIGLPIGLALATHYGRSAPFTALGFMSAIVWGVVAFGLPQIRGHLSAPRGNPVREFLSIIRKPNHQRAFLFTASVVFGSFTVIPFIGPYMTTNAGRTEADLPIIYAIAGACTLVSMNVIGRLTDRFARPHLFRIFALLTIGTAIVVTNLPAVSLWVAVVITSAFMVFSSGRMVPAHAMILGCATAQQRGGFVSVNTAVQHLVTGLAPMISGAIVTRNADGTLNGYPVVGLVAALFAGLSVFLVGRMKPMEGMIEPAPRIDIPGDSAKEMVAV